VSVLRPLRLTTRYRRARMRRLARQAMDIAVWGVVTLLLGLVVAAALIGLVTGKA
jgi:hypothetical protein